MNRKGFTLVEALLVIAIIGVLLLTLIPSVIIIINKNKEKTFNSTRDSIISAAKMYVAENKYDLPIDCSGNNNAYLEISLDNLVGYGNLSSKPSGFPNVILEYNCSTKEFNYKKDNFTDYSELTYQE